MLNTRGKPAMKACYWLAGLLLALTALTAHADDDTDGLWYGNYLYRMCEADPKGDAHAVVNWTRCHAYIVGVVDSYHLFMARDVCLPEGVQTGQFVDVARNYFADHPEERHERSAVLVVRAIEAAWPCDERG
jgi:hypothetical protein